MVSRDELVIETPTLFEAEEGDSDGEEISTGRTQDNHQFSIDDEDDDFEDFADFDDGEALTNIKKLKKKD